MGEEKSVSIQGEKKRDILTNNIPHIRGYIYHREVLDDNIELVVDVWIKKGADATKERLSWVWDRLDEEYIEVKT